MANRSRGQRLYLRGGGLIFALPLLGGGAILLASEVRAAPPAAFAAIAGTLGLYITAVVLLIRGRRARGSADPVGGKITLGLCHALVVLFMGLGLLLLVFDAATDGGHPHGFPAVVLFLFLAPFVLPVWLIGLIVWLVLAVFRPPRIKPAASPESDGAG